MLENTVFEQNKYFLTSTGDYKIVYNSFRLMKWIWY